MTTNQILDEYDQAVAKRDATLARHEEEVKNGIPWPVCARFSLEAETYGQLKLAARRAKRKAKRAGLQLKLPPLPKLSDEAMTIRRYDEQTMAQRLMGFYPYPYQGGRIKIRLKPRFRLVEEKSP